MTSTRQPCEGTVAGHGLMIPCRRGREHPSWCSVRQFPRAHVAGAGDRRRRASARACKTDGAKAGAGAARPPLPPRRPSTPAGASSRSASSSRSRRAEQRAGSCTASTSTPTPACCSCSSDRRASTLLDEEHAHPARHDLHRRRPAHRRHRRERGAADRRRAPGRGGRRSTCSRSAAGSRAKLGIRAGQQGRVQGIPVAVSGAAAADAGDAGRRAASRSAPGLRAEVRRHPRAGHRDAARAQGGPPRWRSRRAWATTRRRSSPRSWRRSRWGRRARRARSCSTARSSRSTTAGQPVGFQRLQDRIHLQGARRRAARRAVGPSRSWPSICCATGDEDLCPLPLRERRRGSSRARPDGRRGPAICAPGRGATARRSWTRRARRAGRDSSPRTPARPTGRASARSSGASSSWSSGRSGRRRLDRAARLARRFGALLLGVPDGRRAPALRGPRGRRLHREGARRACGACSRTRETAASPFESLPPANERPHWVRPELVAEVQFSDWTDDGHLRHPVYLGLRDDVPAAEVRVEVASATHNSGVAAATPTQGGSSRARRPPPTMPELARMLGRPRGARGAGGGRLALPDGAALELGNLNKPLWPELGLTKGELLRYYVAVAPYLLPVVRDRPLVMRRFPDGIDGPSFYQHRAPDEAAARRARRERSPATTCRRASSAARWRRCSTWPSSRRSRRTPGSRARSPLEMDFAAIDLDPDGRGAVLARARRRALGARRARALGVTGYLKTSGASGLHIYMPLRPGTPYEAGMLFCQIVAELVAARHPEAATVERDGRASATSARSTSTTCRTSTARRWPAPTARAPATSPAPRRRSPGTSSTTGLDPRDFTIRTLPGAPARGRRSLGGLARGAGHRSGGGARRRASRRATARVDARPRLPPGLGGKSTGHHTTRRIRHAFENLALVCSR